MPINNPSGTEISIANPTIKIEPVIPFKTPPGMGSPFIFAIKAAGFEVYDLGVDVPTSKFAEEIKRLNPDIVGISALLTSTVGRQEEIIEYLKEEGMREQVKVMIGGAPISQSWADKIGADGYAEDAIGAVRVAKNLL